MKHDMTTPCGNCPFRTDVRPYIRPERVQEIRDTMMKDQSSFPCHKTTTHDEDDEYTPTGDESQCAGALILMAKSGASTQLSRISERLGLHDPTKLNMDAPVYASWADMVAAHRPKKKRSRKKKKGPPGGEAIWNYLTELGGSALITEVADHFGCTPDDVEACVDDILPDEAEGLSITAGYMGSTGAVAYDDDEREIKAY